MNPAEIDRRRFIDNMFQDRLFFADCFPASVLGHDYRLAKRLVQERRRVLSTLWAPFGITGVTFLEPRVTRRLAVAHHIIGISLRGHRSSSPSLRFRRRIDLTRDG